MLDRRNFLRLLGGAGAGVVATATVADVGMWAEMMSWLQRKPVWSIPVHKMPQIGMSTLTYADINAITINAITIKSITPHLDDLLFKPSPVFQAMMRNSVKAKINDGWKMINIPFATDIIL